MDHLQLEPFAEITGDAYRFGYRAIGTDDCLSTIDVPTFIVESAVLARVTLAAGIEPDGTVISQILMSHANGSAPDISTKAASIEALVQKAVNAENLHIEEATVADLGMLLQRLEDSVTLVRGAISQMTINKAHASV
jgi:hypothetical protein